MCHDMCLVQVCKFIEAVQRRDHPGMGSWGERLSFSWRKEPGTDGDRGVSAVGDPGGMDGEREASEIFWEKSWDLQVCLQEIQGA